MVSVWGLVQRLRRGAGWNRLEPAGTACNASGLSLVNFQVFEAEYVRSSDETAVSSGRCVGAGPQPDQRPVPSLRASDFGWEPVPAVLRPQARDSPVCTVTTGEGRQGRFVNRPPWCVLGGAIECVVPAPPSPKCLGSGVSSLRP